MEKPNDDGEMSLVGHLSELRVRLIISLLALVACTLIVLPFAWDILDFLIAPISHLPEPPRGRVAIRLAVENDGVLRIDNLEQLRALDRDALTRLLADSPIELAINDQPTTAATAEPTVFIGGRHRSALRYPSPIDPFMVPVKVALIVGLLLAFPIVLHQTWLFVRPGLTPGERSVVKPMLTGAVFLFPLGAAFAYFMAHLVLRMMQSYQIEGIETIYDVSKYLSLLIGMMVIFGLIFEMPLMIAIATRIGLVHPRILAHFRRHAYVLLAVAAMVLTPADPWSMIAAYIPMLALYELSIILCRPLARMREQDELKSEN